MQIKPPASCVAAGCVRQSAVCASFVRQLAACTSSFVHHATNQRCAPQRQLQLYM